MSHYKPRGKEKRIAKKLQKMMESFRKKHGHLATPTETTIHIDFTVEGVRCNGTEAFTGLLDVQGNLKQNFDELREKQRDLRDQEDDIFLMFLETVNAFTVCPKCKGEKGAFDEAKRGYQRGGWCDCVKCKGRGILFPTQHSEVKKT